MQVCSFITLNKRRMYGLENGCSATSVNEHRDLEHVHDAFLHYHVFPPSIFDVIHPPCSTTATIMIIEV